MSKTYRELLDERKKLDDAIKEARKIEVKQVVLTIKGWIQEFGLTADELGFSNSVRSNASIITSSEDKVDGRKLPPKPKYRNPNNPDETWSGRGSKERRPQ